jgi:hypothetical protein
MPVYHNVLYQVLFSLLLYINDIVDNIQSQVRLFADDTSMFLIVDDAIESADILNRDMNTITSRSNKWLVSFNSHHPFLAMNNQKLKDVEFH